MQVQPSTQLTLSKQTISKWILHPLFTQTIMGLIVFNAILTGLATYSSLNDQYGAWFDFADYVLLWIFTVEIGLRLWVTRPFHTFFRDGWNLFDLIIILSGHILVGGHFVTVLRMVRVLRVLRAISVFPSLRRLISALLLSVPSLGHITFLLVLLYYIFGVIGTTLFAEISPEYFGSLHTSLLSLFHITLLDGAMEIVRLIADEHSWAWAYFISFILLASFIVLNLFIGIIVTNVEQAAEEDRKEQTLSTTDNHELREEMTALRAEIRELKQMLNK